MKLFKALRLLGLEIERRYPGIYYIRGWKAMPDVQIVVTRKLRRKTRRAREGSVEEGRGRGCKGIYPGGCQTDGTRRT